MTTATTTTEQVVEGLRPLTWSSFAQSLVGCYDRTGRLSERQEAAGAKMLAAVALRAERHAYAVEAAQDAPRFPGIVRMFANATSTGLKRPKVRVDGAVLSLAGPASRYPGSVMVTDGGPYGANRYFGRIAPDGCFTPGRDLVPAVLAAMTEVETDPRAAATAYGRRTGSCCLCGRELTDPASVAAGVGPVCAEKFGL